MKGFDPINFIFNYLNINILKKLSKHQLEDELNKKLNNLYLGSATVEEKVLSYENQQKLQIKNDEKILLLDKRLKNDGEIDQYIALNRFNLPNEKEWEKLLPRMIGELLAAGWTTETKIYTKKTYDLYRIDLSTDNEDLIKASNEIFSRYIEEYELEILYRKT